MKDSEDLKQLRIKIIKSIQNTDSGHLGPLFFMP